MLWVLFLYILLVVYGLVGACDGIFALLVTRILLWVGQVLPALLYDLSSPFSLSLSSNLCTTVKASTTVGVHCCFHVKILSDAVRTSRRPLNNWCHLGTKNAHTGTATNPLDESSIKQDDPKNPNKTQQ